MSRTSYMETFLSNVHCFRHKKRDMADWRRDRLVKMWWKREKKYYHAPHTVQKLNKNSNKRSCWSMNYRHRVNVRNKMIMQTGNYQQGISVPLLSMIIIKPLGDAHRKDACFYTLADISRLEANARVMSQLHAVPFAANDNASINTLLSAVIEVSLDKMHQANPFSLSLSLSLSLRSSYHHHTPPFDPPYPFTASLASSPLSLQPPPLSLSLFLTGVSRYKCASERARARARARVRACVRACVRARVCVCVWTRTYRFFGNVHVRESTTKRWQVTLGM